MAAHELDAQVAVLARRQHGVFSRQQVAGLGGTSRIVRARLRSGRWIELDRPVLACSASLPTYARQLKAAELSVTGAAVSGRAAAVLHEIEGFRPGRIEVSAPHGARRSNRLATVRHRLPVPTTIVDGIRVTTVEQTLLDLAGPAPQLVEAAVDDVLARGLTDVSALQAMAARGTRGRLAGARRFAAAVEACGRDGYVPPTNVLERALRVALDHPDLPPAVFEAPLPWRPSAPQRVDALLPAWRRIVEADGRRWHSRRADFERDRRRDHDAQVHGYEVTRFSHDQLIGAPEQSVAVLLAIGRNRVDLREAA